MPATTFRFVVSDENGRRSGTWKLSAQHSEENRDIYLFHRPTAKALKVSLHHSGKCHVKFHRAFVEREFPAGHQKRADLYIHEWWLDEIGSTGSSRAFSIIIPASAVTIENSPVPNGTVKVAAPAPGLAVEIVVAVTPNGTRQISDDQLASQNGAVLSRIQLGPHGEIALLRFEGPAPQLSPFHGARTDLRSGQDTSKVSGELRMIAFVPGRKDVLSIVESRVEDTTGLLD